MKLHLPSSLRKALLAVIAATSVTSVTQAAIMHPSVSLLTYTDFGSNMGRYSIYQQNELLQHLNQGGIKISYTYKDDVYTLQHGMISYESMVDGGPFTAISYNATATVQHNGVTNPVFTGRFIGSDQAIHYAGIEYRSCENNTFLLTPQIDYKVTRISKVITDITPSTLYDAKTHMQNGDNINDMLQYRAGGGYMQQADETGKTTWLTGAYTYVVGGIVDNWSFGYSSGYDYKTGTPAKWDGRGMPDDSYTLSIKGVIDFTRDTAGTASHPMPFVTQGGDSGSPVWVWDTYSNSYQLISCHQARGSYDSYSRGASEWTKETLKSFCVDVDMDKAGHTVHIGEIREVEGKSKTYEALANGSTHASTTTKIGSVHSENDQVNKDFIGIEHGKNTWLNLYDLKDGQKTDDSGTTKNVNWYAYGNEYLNATNTATSDIQYADLFMTENLVFSSSATSNDIILDADVDLGIGYAQFSKTSESGKAKFTITGHDDAGGRDYNFNHAGYIIDKDVDVHLQIANREVERGTGKEYFHEWRKTGEGDLYLEGTGDNYIFLNVGGKGTTFLREQGNGYAAYNVLINNGATVNLNGNIEQVKRDVTFGYGGGVLDFAGKVTMDWYKTVAGGPKEGCFMISALTQDAIIANTASGTTTTLTYKEGGETNFLGSFQDGNGSGTLKVVYDANGTWTLNSIHTKLSGQSGLEVKNGTVVLVGTNTVHAQGSLNGYNQQRYSNEDDWHYADAAMNVTVDTGATFELGSHARLTGDVTVQSGGTFLMREGVRHEMEYIEGWYKLESTYDIADYYGLHGKVNLESGTQMQVQFSEKTDANTTLKGNISGSGSMTVNTGKGSLTLAGDNSGFGGSKQLEGGVLILQNMKAAGNISTNKWKLSESSWMTVENTDAATALSAVDKTSKGVLALSQDEDGTPINLDTVGYGNLIIGAREGEVIQFGKETGETRAYAAVGGKWNLGGGGGNLVVNYKLDDDNGTLVLGNEYTTGSVTLTNTDNNIHAIDFAGKVTLAYTDSKALGGADINLNYTNRIMGAEGTIDLINHDADGVMLLDKMGGVANIDLSGHEQLYLGVSENTTYSGGFTLGENSSYNFGGSTATLTLTEALTDQGGVWGTNLYIDAEGYTGGVVELQKALEINGGVYINIRDVYYKEIPGGEITLKVDEDNAFDSTQGVFLWAGGTLDINGHNQILNSYLAEVGSAIIDSSLDKSGVLTLKGEDWNSFDGSLDVGTLVIDAEGILYMGGDSTYRVLEIKRGNVHLSSSNALSATGRTVLEDNATMNISNGTATANLELQGSTVELGDAEATAKPAGHLAGTLTVAADTTGTVNFAVDGSTLSAVVDTGKDGRLRLTGNRGTVSSSLINADGSEEGASGGQETGGNVDVELNELRLQSGGSIAIGGTLNLKGLGNGLILSSGGSANNMERNISHMSVEKGLALTIQEDSWNTIWNIHKLTGEGNITWNSKTVHWYSARMVLDGSNDFKGTFKAERTAADEAGRLYGSFVELAHDEALQDATLEMLGKQTDKGLSMMTLALNTDNAKLPGLKGNELTAIYAGASIEGESKTGAPLKTEPHSVRNATLTITGNGEYDFKGKVFGAAEGDTSSAGIDLVMEGTGTQKFSGETVQFNNVTVQSGTLVLSSTGLELADRATIYRGATLDMAGSAYHLENGTTLMVAGTDLQRQAALNAALKLGGGVLGFDGRAISAGAESYALSVSGLQKGEQETLDVLFESTFALQTGEYKLASGADWTNITNDNYHALGLDYYKAEFNANESGLSVTLSLKENSAVWAGNSQNTIWSTTDFGTVTEVPGENDTVVFNNVAESKNVQVDGEQKVGRLLFDSTGAYTVKGTEGSSLQAGSLRQTSYGTSTLGNGVNIAGLAEINAGTLVLEEGSQVHNASVAADAALQLESANALSGAVEGDGVVKVAWNAADTGSVNLGEKGVGAMVVESGTLEVTEAVNVQRQLVVTESGTLRSSTGNILKQEGMPLELGGKLVIDHSGGAELKLATAITGAGDKLGTIEKAGSGRLTITSSVAADSLTVNQGSVYITEDAYLADFLANTKNLVVKGGRAELGGNAFTHNTDGYATNLSVDGSNAILHLALGQSSTKTFQGGLLVKNGSRLELHDGGLQIKGNITLGASDSDRVTLWGNWGQANSSSKAGIILAGEVSGKGTVVLARGDQAHDQCVTLINDGNTFGGIFEVNSKTSLVVGAEKAISHASIDLNGGKLVLGMENISTQSLQGSATGSSIALKGVDSSTLTVNQTADGVYAGSIGSGISLVKQGDKTLGLGNANSEFTGSVAVNSGTLALDATATGMLNRATELTVAAGATLQTAAEVTLAHDATISGTLALGGTMNTTAKLTVAGTANIILGGSYEDGESTGTRIYNVFATSGSGSVEGWESMTSDKFSGFGSAERGATIEVVQAPVENKYQVKVSTDNIKAMEITWSKDVAVGTWDSDNANFTENGERTAYYAGDTVTIESDANITMGTTVNLHATEQHTTAGTLNVQGGANATVNQTAGNTLNMDVLHVKEGSHLVMTTEAGNFAEAAIVDGGSTLEVRISSNSRSGMVGSVSGEGILQIANTGTLNIDDGSSNRLSGGSIDASEFRGTLALGNGSSQLRFHSTNLSGLAGDAVIEVNRGAQYWAGGNDRTLDNDIIIHASNAGSGTKDGFGSVRDVTTFNGNVSIDGNAMVSGLGGRNNECDSITFNAAISGVNDNDTLTFGNGYGSSHAMTFTLTENANATNLANMVVAKSGGSKTTVNVDTGDGLAENLKFAANVGGNAEVNLNGGGTLQRLESRAGDGVVNLADGKSLKIAGGADFGGTVNVADAVTLTTMDREDGAAHVEGSVSYSVNGRDASISSETGSRMENISIDLKEATRLQMQNITLSANSRITDAAATLVADGLGLEANVGTNLKPLTYADAKAPAMVQQSADKVVSFTLENVQDVSIEGMGSGLFITLVGDSANILAGADWLELGLGTDAVFTDNLAVTLQFIDSAGMQQSVEGTYTMETVAALAAAGSTYDRVYFNVTGAVENSNVPEPASSTLSLLALAALAARRRRK